jgi:hypothetical protein
VSKKAKHEEKYFQIRHVEIPQEDPFGLTDLVCVSSHQPERAEIYSCHDFLSRFVKSSFGRRLKAKNCLHKSARAKSSAEDRPLKYLTNNKKLFHVTVAEGKHDKKVQI